MKQVYQNKHFATQVLFYSPLQLQI